MGMVVATNVSSLFAWRNLQKTDEAMSKSLERLSTGYRINKAADDAAGLAISEKMRAQINGLNQAVRNAQDTISLIQTAEGGLNEIHSILQRMRELTDQAGNDTITSEDRQAIQDEINQLTKELNRIATTTEFNRAKLLDGSFADKQFQIGANAGQSLTFSIGDSRAQKLGAYYGNGEAIKTSDLGGWTAFSVNGIAIDLTSVSTVKGAIDAINAKSNVTGVTASQVETTEVNVGPLADLSALATPQTVTINGVSITVTSSDTLTTFLEKVNAESAKTGVTASRDASDNVIFTDASGGSMKLNAPTAVFASMNGSDVTYEAAIRLSTKIGGSITVAGADAAKLGALDTATYTDSGVNNIDLSSSDKAKDALVALDFAIQNVSKERSNLGALQNRLEHTIANLQVTAENLTAAESRIRSVDMAAEMSNFTRQQVLMQAGTAMLAQANAKPQAILQLLR